MNAAGLRLRAALEEYVRSIEGDTGTRRGGVRRQQVNTEDAQLVQLSRTLLTQLSGESSNANPVDRDTPGARARNRAATGGQTLESARESARALLNGSPSATNGPAGAPAGGGNHQGGTSQ